MKLYSTEGMFKPTRQFMAGAVAGIGFGLMLGPWLDSGRSNSLLVLVGVIMTITGRFMADADRRRQQESA